MHGAFSTIQKLWLSCLEHDPHEEECRQPEAIPSSPIAPAQKRASQLTQDKPRNSNLAPLSSCLNQGALKTLRPVLYGPRPLTIQEISRMRLTLVGQNPRAHTQLSEKKRRAATPRPLPSRAQVHLTNGHPLKHSNLWPAKASSWLVKPSRRSMLD